MSKGFDPGKWAEREAALWLEAASQKAHDFAFHRYPDAKAARGALAAQPADFLVAACGNTYHLEVKETKQINRLPKAKVRQFGMLKKFHWAGITPYVVVYRSEREDWIYLGPSQLFCFEDCPPSFDMTHLQIYPNCAAVLQEILK